MEFMDVVKARRSVRSYADVDVEEEKLNLMFEAARLAPSWANKQCWSYVLVNDEEKIKKLAGGVVNSWMKKAKAPWRVKRVSSPWRLTRSATRCRSITTPRVVRIACK